MYISNDGLFIDAANYRAFAPELPEESQRKNKMKAPVIRVWKTSCDFIVAIDQHCYEMNHSADQPNGACIYLGTELSLNDVYPELSREDNIPLAILQQTVNLVMRMRE